MKWGLLLSALLFSVLSQAQSLRARALAEANIDELSQEQQAQATNATDAHVTDTGMLSLKDPRPEIITRPWNYSAALTLQNFKASGKASKEGTGTFDLGKNDETMMPGLEFGLMSKSLPTGAVSWKLGTRAKASFSSQESPVTLNSGYVVDDARLNTSLLSIGPAVSLQWERLSWLSLNLTAQFGSLTYTQSSSNEFATFSKHAGFTSWNYGLDFGLTKKWSVFTEWSQRNLNDKTEIALQNDSFELGTKVTW